MAVSYYSTIIQHDADKVWDTLRDFNGLATWFGSSVSESHIEDGLTGATVGAVRNFQLGESRIRSGCSPCRTSTAATPTGSAIRPRST